MTLRRQVTYSTDPGQLSRQLAELERSVDRELREAYQALLPRFRVRDVVRGNVQARLWDAVLVHAGEAARQVLLPAATGADAGALVAVVVVDATNAVTVQSAGAARVQDGTSHAIATVGHVLFFWTGTEWWAPSAPDVPEPEVVIYTARLSSDFSKTNTTLADVTGLGVAVGANEVWTIQWALWVTLAAAGGIKVAVTVPAGATLRLWGVTHATSGLNNAIGNTTTGGGALNMSPAAGTTAVVVLHATVVNGATAGTAQLQAAQQTTNATATVITANSHVQALKEAA